MFRGARKEELILIADELGEIINPEMKVLDLKNLILNSDKYKTDKVFIDDYLDSIIADRKSKEEQESLTEQSKLEFEKIKLEQIKLETELDNSNDEFGKITLSSAFGENVEAKLIKTSIALGNNSLNHPMDCLVAITDQLNAEALIPPSLYEPLCSVNDKTIKKEKTCKGCQLRKSEKIGDYFNKRSSVKNFSIGEQAVLLIPDSNNKIYTRWIGPGETIQHHPPHSYKVKLPDGTVRHVHVNKIRKYHPRALAVGVIFEDDREFGEIHPTPNLSRSTSERVLHETDLNHLKETEREQVLAILLKQVM
ncbi:retrovirus-related Pol polyprotein from transposon 17.6 [Trichonephila clavata]|uniref:Retrovirus-related Pol polyprotein from transposon 17.6 n=1 Tax=Trichonephila clavata TaxID=2740835 RepID=A0A8X6HZX2_TRICU|nr:retrovirus-related Pol polyprotein from transposon 17.6 [Trichonephila clavata]